MIQTRPQPERPYAILREVEKAVNRPLRVEDKLEGPCGKPPAVFHRWPPRWHKQKLGGYTLKGRYCKDCGLFEGVMY